MADQWVYDFAEGSREMRDLLGGKGANVAEMTRVLGAERVPAGFTITTAACVAYMKADQEEPDGMADQVAEALERLQEHTGKQLGDDDDPLLVSVRSGARESMPGMLDTVLNLGLNDTLGRGPGQATENARFAWDSYRRFVQMFGNVCRGIDGERFEKEISNVKTDAGVEEDTDLDVDELKELTQRFKALYKEHTDDEFPQDPPEQLRLAIRAVFDSWTGERAIAYRRINRIPDDWGTAVNVQQMVFGNKGDDSGSGVAFSRDEVTGAPEPSGDFLPNAQGEDVVSGARTPRDIREMKDWLPDAHAQLMDILRDAREALRGHAGHRVHGGGGAALHAPDAQRQAAGAGRGALRARRRRRRAARPRPGADDRRGRDAHRPAGQDVRPQGRLRDHRQGRPAAPGGAKGEVVFSAKEAVEAAAEDPPRAVVLVRPDTNANDVAGFHAAKGILTSLGGKATPRRPGRPRHGRPVRDRRLRARHQPRRARHPRRRAHHQGRRLHRHQRDDRRDHARRRPARRPHRGPGLRRDPEGVRDGAGLGRRHAPPRHPHERRHAAGRRARRASWARRASACAARSTCSWPRTASRRCAR